MSDKFCVIFQFLVKFWVSCQLNFVPFVNCPFYLGHWSVIS